MPLTRDFKETIRDRVQRDPRFRKDFSAKAWKPCFRAKSR
jgi:hypothetical protein